MGAAKPTSVDGDVPRPSADESSAHDPPPTSLWGAPLRASESQTQFLGDLCSGTITQAPLPFDMGEYSVTRMIGRGGMGVVFEGEHRRMQRRVAIKVLHANMAETESAQDQFLAEIRTVARLLHPRIVTAFDAGQYESIVYLVMEYVDGKSLDRFSVPGSPMEVGRALECVQKAAEGLAHAHLNNIIHRDVKPGNMMLSRDGELKLLDLGLAAFTHELIDSEEDGNSKPICGTPEFMAPEQFEGRDLTESIDIYALGCTLYQLLTGAPPFRGSFFELMRAHCGSLPPALDRLNWGDVSGNALSGDRSSSEALVAEVQTLMNEMMGKRPSDRCGSMLEVVERLGRIRTRLPTPNGMSSVTPNAAAESESVFSGTVGGFSVSAHRDGSTDTVGFATLETVGIDLGARNIAAAHFGESHFQGSPESRGLVDSEPHSTADSSGKSGLQASIIPLDRKNPLLATCVAASRSQGWTVGAAALVRLLAGREGCTSAVKLLPGQDTIRLAGQSLPAAMPFALLMQQTFEASASASAEGATLQTTMTVPASFGRVARERMLLAARASGATAVHLIDRNLAAALSQFDFRNDGDGSTPSRPSGHWLVVTINDLTMEISLLGVTSSRVKMLSVVGDLKSGRPRFSRRMMRWVKRRYDKMNQGNSGGSVISDDGISSAKVTEAIGIEKAIDQLGVTEEPEFEIKIDGRKIKGKLTPAMIVNSCGDLIQNFGEMLAQVLSEAGVDGDEVNACLTLGKLTHAKPIRNLLQNFGVRVEPVSVDQHAMAQSVATWSYLSRTIPRSQPRLIPCNAHNLGIGQAEHSGSLVIPRLTALPASVQRRLTLSDTSLGDEPSSRQVTLLESLHAAETKWVPFERMQFEADERNSETMDASIELDDEGRVRFQIASRTVHRISSNFAGDAEIQNLRSLITKKP